MKNVSIGIVSYNSKLDIIECIHSIKKYTKDISYKIYVSDNASSDSTVKLVKETFPDVYLIENETNEGYSTGHNKIINIVDSDYHIILNPDIQFSNNVIKELTDIMDKQTDIALISPKILNFDGTEQHLPKKNPNLLYLLSGRILLKFNLMKKYRDAYTMADQELELFQEVDILTGCFMFFRTDLLQQVNGFDDVYFMYFEDLDLAKRISKLGKVIFYSGTSVIHRWERGSHKNKKLLFEHIKSMFIYFTKRFFRKI